jgi:MFS family permease
MLLASPLLMLDSVGLEFAVIYSFIFLSLMGWIFVFLSREHKPAKAVKPVSKPATVAKEKNYWRSAQLFLLAGPVALLSAACWTLLLSRLLPIALGEQMVVAAFLMPVAWAVLMAWLCIHRDNRTSNIVNAVVAVLGAVAFYLSPGI